MILPLSAVVIAVLAHAGPQGAPGAGQGQKSELEEPISVQDLSEVYKLVLEASGYDNDLNDQKEFKKPTREPTKVMVNVDDESLKTLGTPAAALSAHTGANASGKNAKFSFMFVHAPAMRRITQYRKIKDGARGVVAFIFAHEVRHWLNHDPEYLEQHNLLHFQTWCAKNEKFCDEGDGDKVIEVYEKQTGEEARNLFLKPREQRADLEAREWLGRLVDPKTGKPFGVEAAPDAVQACGQWVKEMIAKGIFKADADGKNGQHDSVAERLKAFHKKTREEKKRAREIEGRAGRAGGQVKF